MTASALAAVPAAQSLFRSGPARMDMADYELKQALATTKLDGKTLNKIAQSSQSFESNFIYEMMKPMFEGIDVDPTFGGGHGEEVFRDLLTEQYGRKIAEHGGLGLATAIRTQLIKQQEASVK